MCRKKDLIDLETTYAEGMIAVYECDRGVSDWEYTEGDESSRYKGKELMFR